MIKSNWPIKSLIKSSDLTFMKIYPINILFDLESTLSFDLRYNEIQLGF
jgi:hypothetical protein